MSERLAAGGETARAGGAAGSAGRRRLARLVTVIALSLSVVGQSAPAAAAGRRGTLTRALDFLHARQYANGGFGEAGRGSSEQLTAWAIVAITSAGQNPSTWMRGRASPVDYLASQSSKWRTTTDHARTVLAAAAAGRNPHSFGGVDLIAKINAAVHSDGASGDRIGNLVNSHTWSMIALRAAGERVTADEIRWLKNQQNSDGGWGWGQNVASDTNDTAAAIQALVAAGEPRGSTVVRKAVGYLRARQRADGGFSFVGPASDSASTSWAIQALVAAGERVEGNRWRKRGGNPMSWLCRMQASSGAVRYSGSRMQNPLFMTVQAIPALALRPFPVKFSSRLGRASRAGPFIRPIRLAYGSRLPRGSRVRIILEVRDGVGGTGVAPGGVRVRIDGVGRGRATMSGTRVAMDAGVMAPGLHTLHVRATDRAGNTSTFDGWRFVVGGAASAGSMSAVTSPQASSAATGTGTGSGAGSGAGSAVGDGQDATTPIGQSPESSGAAAGGRSQTITADSWDEALGTESATRAPSAADVSDLGGHTLLALTLLLPAVGGVFVVHRYTDKPARLRRKSRKQH